MIGPDDKCALQIIRLATEQAERIRTTVLDRDAVLEQAAKNLAEWYPDNASTNAFCAALRSMKWDSVLASAVGARGTP